MSAFTRPHNKILLLLFMLFPCRTLHVAVSGNTSCWISDQLTCTRFLWRLLTTFPKETVGRRLKTNLVQRPTNTAFCSLWTEIEGLINFRRDLGSQVLLGCAYCFGYVSNRQQRLTQLLHYFKGIPALFQPAFWWEQIKPCTSVGLHFY